MLIWQQPLMLASSGGGSIPIQANSKYIPTNVSLTDNASITRDSDNMITWYVTNGTRGGTVTAAHNFNKGPVIALTGIWRFAGMSERIHINVGGKTTVLYRDGVTSVSLDGSGTGMAATGSNDIQIKLVVDLNAATSTVYQYYNKAWVLRKSVPFIADTTKLTGYVYVTGSDSATYNDSSFFYNAGIYNNANLLAS